MPFEHDLFISYAHIDNQPLTVEQQGWVTRFHATLSAQLSMRLGSVARIWRDDKLRGNDVFADEIEQQFGRTALLVSVLTPRYLASDWCRRELTGFCTEFGRSGGLAPANKQRVFKVVKTPVDDIAGLPASLRDTKGYDFFTDCDGAPLELDPAYGVKYSEGYFRLVAVLSWELAQLLKVLQAPVAGLAPGVGAANDAAHDAAHDAAQPARPPTAAEADAGAVPGSSNDTAGLPNTPAAAAGDDQRPVVYLAECTADRREVRSMLDAELKLHGVRVLPEQALPRDDEAGYNAAVVAQLAQCALSIHLVGAVYGAVPDGAGDKSVSVLQNEAAARQCRNGSLQRLIWLPEGTTSLQPQQQAFIQRLLEDDDAQFGADLLSADVEALKTAMHVMLKKLQQPKPVPALAPAQALARAAALADDGAAPGGLAATTSPRAAPLVYLLCDALDRKATVPLRRWLKDHGLDVALPAFEGAAAQVRTANEQLVATCDAVLLFYGAGDEAWKRTTDNDLVKRRGLRGVGAPALFTWLDTPTSADKVDLVDMAEPGLIDGRAGFDDLLLRPLLHTLVAQRAAAAAGAQP